MCDLHMTFSMYYEDVLRIVSYSMAVRLSSSFEMIHARVFSSWTRMPLLRRVTTWVPFGLSVCLLPPAIAIV